MPRLTSAGAVAAVLECPVAAVPSEDDRASRLRSGHNKPEGADLPLPAAAAPPKAAPSVVMSA